MFIAPTTAELIADNQLLPDNLRECAVVLTFGEPIPARLAGDFLRIQLTSGMLAGGEDQFFRADMIQPHRTGPKSCPNCRRLMRQESANTWRCMNSACRLVSGQPTREIAFGGGPVRGVVRLMIASDFVVQTEQGERLKQVVLLLDRRYRPEVLAAVKRTAHQICDERGWKLV